MSGTAMETQESQEKMGPIKSITLNSAVNSKDESLMKKLCTLCSYQRYRSFSPTAVVRFLLDEIIDQKIAEQQKAMSAAS